MFRGGTSMDKKKTGLIIGGSVAAVVVISVIVVSVILANRPSAILIRAAANTIADAKRIELYSVADDVANGGSVAISANLDSIANDDVFVQGKFYSDAKNLRGAYEFTVFEDDDVVLQPTLMYNQDNVAFTCPELLDGAYGVSIKNLAKNLPGSIFDPDEETDFSLTDDQYDYFMNMKDTVKNDKNLQKDIDKMAEKYRQLAINTFVKYAEVTKGSKKITVGGDTFNCTVISIEIDEEALALAMQDMIDYANNDKELEKLLTRFANSVSYYEDPDDYLDSFYDSLDDLEDELDDLEDIDIEIRVDVYVTKAGTRIAQIDASFEVEDEELEMSLVLGKNINKSKEISFEYEVKDGDEYSIVYSVKEDNNKYYEAEIEIESTSYSRYSGYSYTDEYEIKIEWDKKAGDYEMKIETEYSDLVIKGTLLEKGDTYTFVLNNIRTNGNAVPYIKDLELTIVVDRHDTAPKVPTRYTEITSMSERDFKHLTEDIAEGFEEIWDEYFDRW